MRFDHDVIINAPVSAVWSVYSDVERWPEWTESILRVQYLDGDDVKAGARVQIEQPKLPSAVWRVTAVEPGRTWTWVSKAPGMKSTAVHELSDSGDGGTRVHTTIIQDGVLGAIFGRLYARLTRSYLAMEAAGLKQRCEAPTRA
jgi:uncharacterized membrane protein